MTTELTLRAKVLDVLSYGRRDDDPDVAVIDRIADLLSATGVPAYIRVADDLRGVVREEGDQKILDEGRHAATKPASKRTKAEWAALYLVPFIEARMRGENL